MISVIGELGLLTLPEVNGIMPNIVIWMQVVEANDSNVDTEGLVGPWQQKKLGKWTGRGQRRNSCRVQRCWGRVRAPGALV